MTPTLVAVLISVASAAATQRITGLGFALVSAPLLVLAEGPHNGVLLANLLSLVTNLVVLAQTWRSVEPRRVALLAVAALCLVPVGQVVARHMPAAPLMVGIGGLVIAALLAVQFLPRTKLFTGTRGALLAGALSGFMNVTAGVGGPAITLYAVSTGWEHRRFVGSIQLYFAVLNLGSIAAKGFPQIGTGALAAVMVALGLGLAGGTFAARLVPVARARQAVVALALAGAAATVVKGLLLSFAA